MKDLVKIAVVLALIFAFTFLLANISGLFSIDRIKSWLQMAHLRSSVYVGVIVILLLFSDLFIAVPTLSITILSGYLLGFPAGGFYAIVGMIMAGVSGYIISRKYGNLLFRFLIKDQERRSEARQTFKNYGFVMILISRGVPIFPEVTACLSGITKMKFSNFFTAWLLSTIPYAMIASYAGSVSSIENPMPAIYAAISLSIILWISWFIFNRYKV